MARHGRARNLPKGDGHWTHQRKPPTWHDPEDIVVSRVSIKYRQRQTLKAIAARAGINSEDAWDYLIRVADAVIPDLADRIRNLADAERAGVA